MKKKIIYFIGPGRSGSTILSITLSNIPSISYFGELSSFWLLKGIPRNGNEKDVLFWKKLVENNYKLQDGLNENFYRNFEHHFSLLNPIRFLFSSKKQYAKSNIELYTSLLDTNNSSVLIDSSHYPLRAYLINKYLKTRFDIYFIYLARDIKSVIGSFQKKNIEQNYKSPLSANLYYFFVSLLTHIVLFPIKKKRKIYLRYEDFLEKPARTIEYLCSFIGLDYKNKIDFNNLSVPSHIFDGNRLRNNKSIKLKNKVKKKYLNKFWEIFTQIFQSPITLINHYKFRKGY